MISEFRDEGDKNRHEAFQQWRRANNAGFFINCKSEKSAMLHSALCPHSGNTDWEKGDWGSLTANRKLCSENREELVAWAREHGMALAVCSDCKP